MEGPRAGYPRRFITVLVDATGGMRVVVVRKTLGRLRGVIVIFALALGLAQGLGMAPLALAKNPFHVNPKHFAKARQCPVCHSSHQGEGSNILKKALLDTICRECHSPANISAWKAAIVLEVPEKFGEAFKPIIESNPPIGIAVPPPGHPGFPGNQPSSPQGY